MKLILAEKPQMGRMIASVLGKKEEKNGYIILKNLDIVTWGFGHLISLTMPDQMEEYKQWSLSKLPILPDPIPLTVPEEKSKQLNIIGDLLSQAQTCVIATDKGREGELIGRNILEYFNFKGEVKRLWIDDLTEKTISNGFKMLLDGHEKDALAAAAKVRSYADYWIGFTASRFFSLVASSVTGEKTILSAGRVQTPTLRIVYDRELEIENFKAEPFYTLEGTFNQNENSFIGKLLSSDDKTKILRFSSRAEAEAFKEKLTGEESEITKIDVNKVKKKAPMLFDGTSLKKSALKSLKFSPEHTIALLQKIYEKGLVSYPRTESRHLSENVADELADNLRGMKEQGIYVDLFPESIQSLKGNKRFVDNEKAQEHHAIVITGKSPLGLSGDEKALYELILRATLASHHNVGIDEVSSITTTVNNENFITKGTVLVEQGWRKIYPEEEISSEQLPPLKLGEVAAESIQIHEGHTTAPKRLTLPDLEHIMLHAGRLVDEDKEQEVALYLKDRGIGTVATRTQIILNLEKQGYIHVSKNQIHLTDKGRRFMGMIYEHPITSVELTGEFEKKLHDIEKGVLDAQIVIDEYKRFVSDVLNEKEQLIKHITNNYLHDSKKGVFETRKNDLLCPKCSKSLVEQAEFWGCSGYQDGCSFTLSKSYRKVKLNNKAIQSLINGKQLLLKSKSAEGNDYTLILYLDDKKKLASRFATSEDVGLGKCPECGKQVLEREKFYGCSGYKQGCKFTLNKTFLKKKITNAQVKKILESGKTGTIKGFQGKYGPFDAALGYSKEQKRLVILK